MKHGTPSQANRGPKNPGRSVARLLLGPDLYEAPDVKKFFLDVA